MKIQLIVGLGNPGAQYEQTRHNVGFWFVDLIARQCTVSFRAENKFQGEIAKASIVGVDNVAADVWLLKPMTFMNNSGQSIGALSRFYKIPVEAMLVVHDELDLPSGTARLKKSGGHGGHNGLRDTIAHLGVNTFNRLRLGIDHPG
ncbi:MAG: aminoacyl-tRNA hydrolase, partial [Thiohalomonadales bacterium]